MRSKRVYRDDAARALGRRVERAIAALTDNLNGYVPRGRGRLPRLKKTRPYAPAGDRRAVLLALVRALELEAESGGLGARTWYQLREETSLGDGALGLALSSLIPTLVCTRDEGGEHRLYFLPQAERRRLRAKIGAGSGALAA